MYRPEFAHLQRRLFRLAPRSCKQGRGRLEGQDGSLDDVNALANLVLLDDEGRGQANDVTVSGLGQESVVPKAQADLPGVIVWRRRTKQWRNLSHGIFTLGNHWRI